MLRCYPLRFSSVLALLVLAACVESPRSHELVASDQVDPATAELPPTAAIGLPGFPGPPLCRPLDGYECHPLDPSSCDPGEGCYSLSDLSLVCAPAFPGRMGDPCEYVNTCDPGLMCAASWVLDGCDNDVGCCTPYCEVGVRHSCPPHFECVSIVEDDAPRCYEDLGVCVSA